MPMKYYVMERCGSTNALTIIRAPWKEVIYNSLHIWLPVPISSFFKDNIALMSQVRGQILQNQK